jgi:hypothetical protein
MKQSGESARLPGAENPPRMQSKLQNLQPPLPRREKNATAATCSTLSVFRPSENGTHHYGLSAGRVNTGHFQKYGILRA